MALSKAEILQASRERDRHKRRVSRLIGCLVMVAIVGFFLLVVNLSFFRVTSVEIIGQTSADQATIKQFVDNQLAGRYFGLVPKSSVFFVSKGILIKNITKQFPGLAKVTITWPDLNTLAITVTDRESKVLWCIDGEKDKKCYYLEPAGTAYQEAPNFSDSLYIELHSKLPLQKIGDKVIDPKALIRSTAFLNFVKSSISLWPSPDLQLLKADVYSQNDFIAILVKPSDPVWQGRVLFNIDQSANTIITNYHSVLKNDKFRQDWLAGGGRLYYLDLRFPGKVFYRFR